MNMSTTVTYNAATRTWTAIVTNGNVSSIGRHCHREQAVRIAYQAAR